MAPVFSRLVNVQRRGFPASRGARLLSGSCRRCAASGNVATPNRYNAFLKDRNAPSDDASPLISFPSTGVQKTLTDVSSVRQQSALVPPASDELLKFSDTFGKRHVGPNPQQVEEMCKKLGVNSVAELMEQTIPNHIRRELPNTLLKSPNTRSETEVLDILKNIMEQNVAAKNFIGQGYYGTVTPAVIQRSFFENPAWYTAYTPYQAEISQGRLESLVNFQTIVCELTGMDIANASLLDEGTAAAEGLGMLLRLVNRKQKNQFFISDSVHKQTQKVLETRAKYFGVELIIGSTEGFDFSKERLIGALVQYPDTFGKLQDFTDVAKTLHENKAYLIVAADPLNLLVSKSPASMGADVVVGNMQRFGVPMFSGGPSAAYIATDMKHLRKIPGRIIGISKDIDEKDAYRLTLQTREQHIRLDKATSNVCTAQALLANASAFYAIYHTKAGLIAIAERVHGMAQLFTGVCQDVLNLKVAERDHYFDTVSVDVSPISAHEIASRLRNDYQCNVRVVDNTHICLSFDESHSLEDTEYIAEALGAVMYADKRVTKAVEAYIKEMKTPLLTGEKGSSKTSDDSSKIQIGSMAKDFARQDQDKMLNQKIFNSITSETEMMRYMYRLQSLDLSLVHSMITLGSCTMKLNSTSSLLPISWDSVANVHPFAPVDSVKGYREMLHQLEQYLCSITAFDACSLQPASGAAGEYAGLLAIRRYHESRGDGQRSLCIIPKSAHGTNPASAAMINMDVKWIDDMNGMPLEELEAICKANRDTLGALMITYPSTHGIFEENIKEICDCIHKYGGMVYMDGANMNAQMGLTAPGVIGADVCHLNLHKTFSIPHGGGGPGMGPICCNKTLAPFLPGHKYLPGVGSSQYAVQSAPFGQAGIAVIPWMFISMLGHTGIRQSAEVAILSANYMKARLAPHYDIKRGNKSHDRCSHEFIVDVGKIKATSGITEEDIAKRLQDYGFHAPTMSWPVHHSLMIEPTESEDLPELDRFCDALIQIRKEIEKVEKGEWDANDNPLKNAPHPQDRLVQSEWTHPYTREEAAFPLPYIKERGKFWPSVGRVSNAYGDRNIKLTHDA